MVVQGAADELCISRLFQKVSYIIAIDSREELSEKVLRFLLDHLIRNFGEMEVILVVYGGDNDIASSTLNKVEFLDLETCRNRSTALNSAAKVAQGDVLIFADPFIWLSTSDIQQLVLKTQIFEAVSPNKNRLLIASKLDDCLQNKIVDQFEDKTAKTNFAAHILLIHRVVFERLGGWDEKIQDSFASTVALAHLIAHTTRNYTLAIPAVQLVAPPSPHPNLTDESYLAEIETLSGLALTRYSQRLRKQSEALTTSKIRLRFVLAVTTYNRKDYLQQFIESWLATRSIAVEWSLIIADDGSTDGTLDYIRSLRIPATKLILIENYRSDVLHQTNTILRQLNKLAFDVCFKCDDDILFVKEGWDKLYWTTIQRTGYEHLVYYNKKWRPALTHAVPQQCGQLISHCDLSHLQGAFFTITPAILHTVGYFDAYHLGFRGYEHNDYTARCSRAGFNVLDSPFDVYGSNDFIALQGKLNYVRAMSLAMEKAIQSDRELAAKKQLIYQNRVYVPFNQIEASLQQVEQQNGRDESVMNNQSMLFRLADERWVWSRGVVSVLGSILKKGYNFCLRRKWFAVPRLIKQAGRFFLQLGDDLVNIDT